MDLKKLNYYSFGVKNLPGVIKKVDNTVKAAIKLGYVAEHRCYTSKYSIRIIKDFLLDKSELIFIRFSFFTYLLLLPTIIFKRLMGAKIVVDIPTPRYISINEIRGNKVKFLRIKVLLHYLFGPWIFYAVNTIIQYSEESKYFSFGLKNKILKMGNGIFIDDSIVVVEQNRIANKLCLIGVASLSFWHGYDRLIKAIAIFRERHPMYSIELKIVGDGEVLDDLKELTALLKIEDSVEFTGRLEGEKLDAAYRGANVGVASLGLSRIGLNEASVLKTREYMAKGLCVLGSGTDPDFSEQCNFRFTVPNDETIYPIVNMLLELVQCELPEPRLVRKYAEENLAFEGKLRAIISSL